ncbi:MAG: DUF1203 domain-containing protein [Alphaproteobacteria bacterium]|nr:DUF1203 domain-containing protein [Alphaproteobacteria bacterium]
MTFRFQGLPSERFAPLMALSDAALAGQGIRRVVADEKPGFPCRVSLADAEPGERLLLLNFEHQPVDSPYRASGPIFVREAAVAAFKGTEVPEQLRCRLLSLRAYDAEGMIVDADVTEGTAIETLLERLFADPAVDYVHVHFARRGCFAARVDRG